MIDNPNSLFLGDCLEVLKTLPGNSIDALVTDPPYGIRFMGKSWDGADIVKKATQEAPTEPKLHKDGKVRNPRVDLAREAGKYSRDYADMVAFEDWTRIWAIEVFRVLKPGAHALVFSAPRSYHRMACGIEDAGFEVRDQIQWIFGQGFPKSLDVEKAGAGPEWTGWGTALKPANEPLVLARKPISEKTVVANLSKWGTGAINIDSSRIAHNEKPRMLKAQIDKDVMTGGGKFGQAGRHHDVLELKPNGRFPSNLVFSHSHYCTDDQCDIECAIKMLDEQSGVLHPGGQSSCGKSKGKSMFGIGIDGQPRAAKFKDSGGASRFFYCAKVSSSERNAGLEGMPKKEVRRHGDTGPSDNAKPSGQKALVEANTHPTVKPQKLMRYLCRLVTPPKGVILDPFMGSGSTGLAAKSEGFRFIGIEREPEYFEIAKVRIGQNAI